MNSLPHLNTRTRCAARLMGRPREIHMELGEGFRDHS